MSRGDWGDRLRRKSRDWDSMGKDIVPDAKTLIVHSARRDGSPRRKRAMGWPQGQRLLSAHLGKQMEEMRSQRRFRLKSVQKLYLVCYYVIPSVHEWKSWVSNMYSAGLEADVASESWLQELISSHVNGNQGSFPLEHPHGDIELDDAFDICPDEFVYAVPPFSLQPDEIYSPWIQAGTEKMIPRDLGIFQYTAPGDQVDSLILKENETVPWLCGPGSNFDSDSFLDPWALERVSSVNMLMDPPHCQPFQSPHASQESGSYSPDDPSFLDNFEAGPSFGCSCYEQAMSELVRCGLKGLSSIDELLNCQKELLLQTENILQCEMCSQSEAQANLLMVIVVTIDSLLTTLDSTASGKCAIDDGVSPVGRKSERERGCSFVSQIDACPLLVGGFRVPMEEKTSFVRQVLQARLSMLLLTIRRIRVCMQQHLTLSSSRGRLLMILETDRRLQLIMMKIKMSVG